MSEDFYCECSHDFFEHEGDDDSYQNACLICNCENYEPEL